MSVALFGFLVSYFLDVFEVVEGKQTAEWRGSDLFVGLLECYLVTVPGVSPRPSRPSPVSPGDDRQLDSIDLLMVGESSTKWGSRSPSY